MARSARVTLAARAVLLGLPLLRSLARGAGASRTEAALALSVAVDLRARGRRADSPAGAD